MLKRKYYHQKLIRDKIPEYVKASGDEFETRVMDNSEFEKELKKKLIKEAKELSHASNESLLNELADVLELVKSICSQYKIKFHEVERYQIEKRKKRGGFNKRIFLI